MANPLQGRKKLPTITKTLIDKSPARSKDVWIWDSELKGFGVRIQPSGRKTYVIRYRNQRYQQRKHTIGRCSDLTPEQARALARKAFGRIAEGKDPVADKNAVRDAPTMADLKDRYMREHAIPHKKESSAKDDERLWNREILPRWSKRQVASITQAEIMSLHAGYYQTPAKANHVLALLSKAFNLSIVWGWRTDNPCFGVKKYKIYDRENILTQEETRKLLQTVAAMAATGEIPVPMANLVKLLLLTGCRLNEIMASEQAWVDHDRRLLLLPDSKVGQRKIQLSEPAMAIIRSMPKGKWLIPGRNPNNHMKTPWGMMRRICERAGIKYVRPHDLRHTVGSLSHRAGLSQRDIARLLGHRQLSTTERYLHGYQGDEVRSVDLVASLVVGAAPEEFEESGDGKKVA